jgi:hypothetical protein
MELTSEMQRLARMRREQEIDLADIAAATEIGVADLEAIESGVADRLPGGARRSSYIRRYAQIVDPYMAGARLFRLVALASETKEAGAGWSGGGFLRGRLARLSVG